MIVSVNLRRVLLGISANVGLAACAARGLAFAGLPLSGMDSKPLLGAFIYFLNLKICAKL